MEYKQAKRYLIEIKDTNNLHIFYNAKVTIWSKRELDNIIKEIKENFNDFVVGVSKRDCRLELTELKPTKLLSLY